MNPFPIDVVIAPNDPNVWDVLTAIGTVLAVFAAVGLGLHEQRAASKQITKLEQERNDAVEAAERREREAQARVVAVWTTYRPDAVEPLGGGHEHWSGMTVELHIRNYSNLPIFDFMPAVRVGSDVTGLGHFEPVLQPGARARCDLPEALPDGTPLDEASAAWIFRDLASVWWVRDVRGVYEEVPRDQPE